MVGALILSGGPPALGVVRSLGRHNIPVRAVLGKTDYKLARLSRYCAGIWYWPESNQEHQIEFLLKLGEEHGLYGWVLFATDDQRAALIARNREMLARWFCVPPPNWEVMRWAYDKRLTYQLAAQLGVDHPRTYYPRNREDVSILPAIFPVILKPAYKEFVNGFTLARAWLANDPAALLERYDEAVRMVHPTAVMIQELVPGGNEYQFSYAGLHGQGARIASLVARRKRQYPVDFGCGSSYVETVESSEIESIAARLLEAMSYSGIVEIEFKYDVRDQRYKLLDINPRVWSWHTLGARAGVDFPYLLWRWLQNEAIEQTRGRPGVGWIRMLRDIPAAWEEMSRGHLSPRAYVSSLANVSEFAVFAKDDPLPGLAEIPLMIASKSLRRFSSSQKPRRFYE
jgi:predicted ATP-grasp superfamily ATP-dependent carboligase